MLVLARACATAVVAGVAASSVVAADQVQSLAAVKAWAGAGGCYPIDFTWICVSGGGSPGRPGSGGSATYTCTYTKASPALLQRTGTGPPQPGYQWDIMTCPGS